MRDPDRIPQVLKAIEKIWRVYPDMRLGQLVSNLAAWAEEEVWDIEEDVLVAEVERHLRHRELIERGDIEKLRQGNDSDP